MNPRNDPTRAGRIGALRPIISLLPLVLAAVLLAGCAKDIAKPEGSVFFVTWDHERARNSFRRLEAACNAQGLQQRHRVSLHFVGVDVIDQTALARSLEKVLASRPAAIIAGSSPVLLEASRKTSATPIIFVTHQDPVELNVAASLVQRPPNLTGISFHIGVEDKMLELLRETAPRARRIGYLIDRDEVGRPAINEFVQTSARRHGLQWMVVPVGTIAAFESGIRDVAPVDAWLVSKVAALDEHRERFVAALLTTARPAIYPSQRDVQAGGPMAYEAVFDDPFEALARQLDRVLSGVTPGNIPIERPKRFSLSINVAAARRMGMQLTPEFLARADRVQ